MDHASPFFPVEPRHLEAGTLSEQELSAFVGTPVFLRDLGQYPFSEKLFGGRGELTRDELYVRAEAIYKDFDATTGVESGDFGQLWASGHLDEKAKKTVESANDIAESKHFGIVDGFDEHHLKTAVVIYEPPRDLTFGQMMACFSGLPERAMPESFFAPENDARVKALRVLSLLHEAFHGKQMQSSHFNHGELEKLECHADWGAMLSLCKSEIGRRAASDVLALRYLGMFAGASPEYFLAPRLEAVLEGKPASAFEEVCASVRQIKFAVVKKDSFMEERRLNPDAARQDSLIKSSLQNNPATMFTLLKELVEEKAFAKEPLTEKIAERMVAAAEYLNPAWVEKPVYPAPVKAGVTSALCAG